MFETYTQVSCKNFKEKNCASSQCEIQVLLPISLQVLMVLVETLCSANIDWHRIFTISVGMNEMFMTPASNAVYKWQNIVAGT